MLTYTRLKSDQRKFLALTGLTVGEFQQLLTAFQRCYERQFPPHRTLAGRPRQRLPGGGRHGSISRPEQKLLFILVYLKTYPPQALLGELFEMSQPRANQYIRTLLPLLRDSLDALDVLPERIGGQFAQRTRRPGKPVFIIDATERRRQRPKNPEKQAEFYSGRKKTHSDKNVVVVPVSNQRVEFLSPTYAGKTHEKRIADREAISFPPGTELYKDTGFQGYEPPVKQTYQPKKKDTGPGANASGKADQSKAGQRSSPGGTRLGRR